MAESNLTKKHFFECTSCKTLYLASDHAILHYQCAHCNGKTFDIVENKFLIHCPKCHEYWPKRVVRLVVHEGICECLNRHECDGLLTVRKHWVGTPAQLIRPANSFEKVEILNLDPFPPQPASKTVENDPPVVEDIPPEMRELEEKVDAIQDPEVEDIPPEMQELDEKIDPIRDPFHEIFTQIDFSLDLTSLSSSLTPQIIDQYLMSLKLCYFDEIPLNSSDYLSVLTSTLIRLKSIATPLVQEPVNYVYYVGDVCGDFQQLQNLCNYFIPIIENFPAVKIIFRYR